MQETRVLEFVPFRLDLGAERLWRDAQAVPLTAKAFAVLRYLVIHAGRLVTRDELFEAVWALPAVSDGRRYPGSLGIPRGCKYIPVG